MKLILSKRFKCKHMICTIAKYNYFVKSAYFYFFMWAHKQFFKSQSVCGDLVAPIQINPSHIANSYNQVISHCHQKFNQTHELHDHLYYEDVMWKQLPITYT